ncbi:hypothetical protein EDI_052210 [Entamoeba dispar SAW760]|uniref:Uncharacterized protein n=1 Tax=Entamoeba dispar (strain ATCC PRA-260 / SAW760) TaxID=370354 RepID=B0E5S0_ENTDS|nr:uncharacterized protein EDI_052210 [Entamoeba dispar SAW760]EDR30126.1 hypothetical protein EDI_052210 [Entamoeba dispar SAW760]|eukprot:EDR30126.1 hypothetical protein EDI_052210 [Entamoeba dispar SAW760]
MTTEITDTIKLCEELKSMTNEMINQLNIVKRQVGTDEFQNGKDNLILKIGEIGNFVTMTNKSDYTNPEIEGLQSIIILTHLLYEVTKTWSTENNVEDELNLKISYLQQQTKKLNQIAITEAPKKKVDILNEVAKQIDLGVGKNITKELEKKGIKDVTIDISIAEARIKLVESRKKQEEALKAIEKIYSILEPVKEHWTKEDFIKACFGNVEQKN